MKHGLEYRAISLLIPGENSKGASSFKAEAFGDLPKLNVSGISFEVEFVVSLFAGEFSNFKERAGFQGRGIRPTGWKSFAFVFSSGPPEWPFFVWSLLFRGADGGEVHVDVCLGTCLRSSVCWRLCEH